MNDNGSYQIKQFDLYGLHGISDQTLEMHFKLYAGYVKETNRLMEQIYGYSKDGIVEPSAVEAYSELTRRLGFEYNGMLLHEYYFGNLIKFGSGEPHTKSLFYQAVQASFGSYTSWKADFINKGKMRGVGWVICYQDPALGWLTNHWITLHEIGNVAGFQPILVMDVWEHAFLLDYKPAERAKYVDAFFANINWSTVGDRLIDKRESQRQATP